MNANGYTYYTLSHWEEPEITTEIVASHGKVSVTAESLNQMVQSFHPVAYREGEITLDIPVTDLLRFWSELGGAYGVQS